MTASQMGSRAVDVRVAHTSDLTPRELQAIRDVLHAAFDGEFTDEDWDHALGGMHAIVLDADGVVAHGSVVQRQLFYEGRALRTGYVEAVATRADRQKRGHASRVMAELERIIASAYDLGALGAADEAAQMYVSRGWQVWRGPLQVLSPAGLLATLAEQDCVYIFPTALTLDRSKPLCCDWRVGDVW